VQRTEANATFKAPGQWSGRSLGNRLGYKIFYGLIRLGGRRLAYFALYWVVLYYVLCRPSIRRQSYAYLHHRFPKQSFWKNYVNCYRMFLAMGRLLIDRAIAGTLGTDKMCFTISGRRELLKLVDEGRGFILMLSHVGCWQVALAALNFLKVPVNLLLKREEGNIDRHYFEYPDVSSPVRIIDPDSYLGGTLEMLNVLRKGQILCMMGDRVLGSAKNSLPVDFLNEEAVFPYSAFKIASAARVPVVVLFSSKTGCDSYALDVSQIISVPQNLGRSAESFRPYVKRFVKEMERYVQAHPYQFFNFFNMWQKY
jgi:predicted LPLAT superfamily acyltransferase